jgi:hypothetical protein
MRHERKETIEINRIDYCSCDICGKRCEDEFSDEAKAEVRCHYYPTHISSENKRLHVDFDICLECLKEKIFPLIRYKSTRSDI